MPVTGASGPGAVEATREGYALVLRLVRPECANAYTQPMLASLVEHVERADADPEVRVVVVTGAGSRVFCAGADRGELASRDWRSVLTLASARAFRRLRQSRCVTLAAINGDAVGGGLELALACDLRLAVEGARFWLPETELGLLPAAGATALLPRLVGPLRAREMILAGAAWDAAEAFRNGLLSEVVPAEALFDRVRAWVGRIAGRDADAVALAKQAMDLGSPGPGEPAFELVAQSLLVRGRGAAE